MATPRQQLIDQETEWIDDNFGLAANPDAPYDIDLIDPDNPGRVFCTCTIGDQVFDTGLVDFHCDDVVTIFDAKTPGAFSALLVAAYEGRLGQRLP